DDLIVEKVEEKQRMSTCLTHGNAGEAAIIEEAGFNIDSFKADFPILTNNSKYRIGSLSQPLDPNF
ncbi:hypothetical protein HAX54_020063, partial [Datura stramonium]|nr:hypothetical protein [Datura stramonium]